MNTVTILNRNTHYFYYRVDSDSENDHIVVRINVIDENEITTNKLFCILTKEYINRNINFTPEIVSIKHAKFHGFILGDQVTNQSYIRRCDKILNYIIKNKIEFKNMTNPDDYLYRAQKFVI